MCAYYYNRDAPKHEVKIKFEQICVNGYAGLTVNLDSDVCTHSDIVGNKAKSLFRLKKAIVNGMIDNNVSFAVLSYTNACQINI